jgi:hypothetical protein
MKIFILFIVSILSTSLYSQELKPLSFKSSYIEPKVLRETYSHLSDEAFKMKLEASLENHLLFFRSFVNTYYFDFKEQKHSGLIVDCYGDAHIENFGFILFQEKTRFVMNDLDDSGKCPIEYDSLRYFTSLHLALNNERLIDEMIDFYVDVFENKKKPIKIKKKHIKDLKEKNTKILLKFTRNDHFIPHEEITPIADEEKKKLISLLQSEEFLKAQTIHDLVSADKDAGGSGGLKRYWILVENKAKEKDVLELKEIAKPATTNLINDIIEPSIRLTQVKESFWKESPDFYHVIDFNQGKFLLRSRTKDDVNYKKLKSKELKNYIMAQLSLMASMHSNQVQKMSGDYKAWLKSQTLVLRRRYEQTYQNILNQRK